MQIYVKYIVSVYLKYFFITFFALELFYVGIDFFQISSNIEGGANIKLLYIYFQFQNAINDTLFLSVLFSFIMSMVHLIKSNEIVSFYALGISKFKLIAPFFIISLIISIIYILLGFTSFVNAKEYRDNIKNYSSISKIENNLFLKHKKYYIYFKEFNSIKKEVKGVQIFQVEKSNLVRVIKAKSATFQNDKWSLQDINSTFISQSNTLNEQIIFNEKKESFKFLEDFNPQIIKNLFGKTLYLTIPNTLQTINFFKDEKNRNKFRAMLYKLVVIPLYIPFMIIIIFKFMPINQRSGKLGLLTSFVVLGILLFWGIVLTLSKLAVNGLVVSEVALILPLFALIFLSWKLKS